MFGACCPNNLAAAERELLRDPHFQRGVILLAAEPGKRVPYGTLPGPAAGEPAVWDLCQWSSKLPLAVGQPEALPGGAIRYRNAAKAVIIAKPGSDRADLSLSVTGDVELQARNLSLTAVTVENQHSAGVAGVRSSQKIQLADSGEFLRANISEDFPWHCRVGMLLFQV